LLVCGTGVALFAPTLYPQRLASSPPSSYLLFNIPLHLLRARQTSEPQGMCYIETSNIDGETNLKIKEVRAGAGRGGGVGAWCSLSPALGACVACASPPPGCACVCTPGCVLWALLCVLWLHVRWACVCAGQAVSGVAKVCPTPAAVAAFKGTATYEQPNGSIYTFEGSLLPQGAHADDALPLGPSNMVRVCVWMCVWL
jgi:hypothetical protein